MASGSGWLGARGAEFRIVSNDLTRWLDSQEDKRHHHNWSVVKQPDSFSAARYWMVLFPRGEQNRIAFVREYDDREGVTFAGGNTEIDADRLYFWYNAQRDFND